MTFTAEVILLDDDGDEVDKLNDDVHKGIIMISVDKL